jgi:hypothetical protein
VIGARLEPAVLHLRLDAAAVRGKPNVIGTLRSHADPSEVSKTRVAQQCTSRHWLVCITSYIIDIAPNRAPFCIV